MTQFTLQLAEYLQEQMNENQSIENLDDILQASKEHLFNGAPLQALSVLSDEYHDLFIQQFTMHYLMDEIGHETLTAWKLALASKILDNIDNIEQTYENLQNQIFSDYEIRRVDSKTTDKGDITSEGHSASDSNGSNDENIEFQGKEKGNGSHYYTAVDEFGNPTTPKIKSIHKDEDGDDPIKEYTLSTRNGKVENDVSQNGKVKETVEDFGKVKEHREQNGLERMSDKDGIGEKAYVERTPSGVRQNEQIHTGGMMHGYSDHATDATQALSVTPQSGINASSLMQSQVSPSGSSAGTPGSTENPIQSSDTKYLTQAQHNWNNDREHSEWTKPLDSNGDVITNRESFEQYHDKQITHFNRVQEREYDDLTMDTEQSFENRKRESEREFTNYKTDNDTEYKNLTDKTERHYNKKSTAETVYENNFKEHSDTEKSFEDRKNVQHSEGENHVTADNNGTVTRDLTGTGEVDEKKYKFSYELYMKMEPYMNKLWRQFDELFFLLLDTVP